MVNQQPETHPDRPYHTGFIVLSEGIVLSASGQTGVSSAYGSSLLGEP